MCSRTSPSASVDDAQSRVESFSHLALLSAKLCLLLQNIGPAKMHRAQGVSQYTSSQSSCQVSIIVCFDNCVPTTTLSMTIVAIVVDGGPNAKVAPNRSEVRQEEWLIPRFTINSRATEF